MVFRGLPRAYWEFFFILSGAMKFMCALSLWACLSGCIRESWGRSLIDDAFASVAFTHPSASGQQRWLSAPVCVQKQTAQTRAAVRISKVSIYVIVYVC